MKIIFNLISFLVFCLLIQSNPVYSGSIEQRQVEANGLGKSENEAIQDALIQAISKIEGTSIESSKVSNVKRSILDNKENIQKDFKSKISSYTKGLISSYVLLSSNKDSDMMYQVRLKATIPVYNSGEQTNRLRLAIIPFKINAEAQSTESKEFIQNWTKTLEEALVQTRRFAILDRNYQKETKSELDSYTEGFNTSELARLGKRVGTDYLVTGELQNFIISDKSVKNPLTDEKIVRNKLSSLISLRIIDISSGQIKFAKSYSNGKSASLDIINAIYPMTILSVNANNVVIGSGGDDIKIGQHYRVMSLGAELKDPYTGESLGRQETLIGEIEITDVQFKTSQAKIITGGTQINEKSRKGLIIRPSVDTTNLVKPNKNKLEGHSSPTDSDKNW
jgi:hypothetical protein